MIVRHSRLIGTLQRRVLARVRTLSSIKTAQSPFETIETLKHDPNSIDRTHRELTDFNWLQYESLGSVDVLVSSMEHGVADSSFWVSTAHKCIESPQFLQTGVIKLLKDYSVLFDADLAMIYTVLMAEFIAKSPGTLLFQDFHRALYPRLIELGHRIDWRPVMLAALSSPLLESKGCLRLLHGQINVRNHGFYEHLIPMLIENGTSADQIYRVNRFLVESGDFPKWSAPHFDTVLDMLMRNKMYREVGWLRKFLCADERFRELTTEKWISSRCVLLLIQSIGLGRNQKQELEDFLDRFSEVEYLKTPSCWVAVIQKYKVRESLSPTNKSYKDALSVEDLEAVIRKLGVQETPQMRDAFVVKSTKSMRHFESNVVRELEQISKGNRDTLSPKALGSFFKVYLADSDLEAAEKSLKMLGKFFVAHPVSESQLNYNNQLVRGFLAGLIESKTTTHDEKLTILDRLLEFVTKSESSGLEAPTDKRTTSTHLRTVVQLNTSFASAYLKLGMFSKAFSLLDGLLEALESAKSATPSLFQFQWTMSDDDNLFPSHFSKKLVNTVIDGKTVAKYQERLSRSEHKNKPYTVMKYLMRMQTLDPTSVGAPTWRRLLLNVAYSRSFEETFSFSEWLAQSFGKKDALGMPLVSRSSTCHPLNVIFDDTTVFRFLRIGFLQELVNPAAMDKKAGYQPWLPLQHLAKLSQTYGFVLNPQRIQQDVSYYLKMLYTNDLAPEDHKWKQMRARNPYTIYELAEELNVVLKELNAPSGIDVKRLK